MATTTNGMMMNNSANTTTTTTTVFHVIPGSTTGTNNNNSFVATTFMHHPTPPHAPPVHHTAFAGFLPCQPLPPPLLLPPPFQQPPPPSYWLANLPLTTRRPCSMLVSPPTVVPPPPTRTAVRTDLSALEGNEKMKGKEREEEEERAGAMVVRSGVVVLRPNNCKAADGSLSRYEENVLGKTENKIISDEQLYEDKNTSKRKTCNKKDAQCQIEEQEHLLQQQHRNQHHLHCSFPVYTNQTIAATSGSGTGGVSRSSGGGSSTGSSGGGSISTGGSSGGGCSKSARGSRQVQEKEECGGGRREKGRRGSVRCDGVQQFHKTRMCPFIRTGCFRFRRSCCPYAHSDQELRSSPNLLKTAMCRLHAMNRCTKDADKCFFAHSIDQLRSTHDFYKSKMCKFWLKGVCRAESVCRYAHGQKEVLSVLAHPPSLTSDSTTQHPPASSCSADSSCCLPVDDLERGCVERLDQVGHEHQQPRDDIKRRTSDNEQSETAWRSTDTDVNSSNGSTGGGCGGSTSESPTTAYNQRLYQQHEYYKQHHSYQQEYYQELDRQQQHQKQDLHEMESLCDGQIVIKSQQHRNSIDDEATACNKAHDNNNKQDDQLWWWGQQQQQQFHEQYHTNNRQQTQHKLTTSSDEESHSSTCMSSNISRPSYSSTILSSPSTSSRSSRPSPDIPVPHLCQSSGPLGDGIGSSAPPSGSTLLCQHPPVAAVRPSCPPEFVHSCSPGCLLTRRVCDWCGGYPGGVVGGWGWEGVQESRQKEETQHEVGGKDKVNNDHNNNGVFMGGALAGRRLGGSYSWCLDTFGVLRCSRCSGARPPILDRLEQLNAHPAAGAILQDLQYSCMYRD
eukprot:GHVS01055325.1.p1 GENE.GHVS01055325.1~~GHVS01055325.1.p1  ORF type:complete len:844 (+),score=215.20 GHVS01055325.1:458-2989(+)